MQTILGANGVIGEGLAKELKLKWTSDIKLVGRNPKKVNESDMVFKADLMKYDEVNAALKDTEIAYLTVGLPYDSKVWSTDWKIILENVIKGCIENNVKLVYFDNTYPYAQDAAIQTEETAFGSSGIKGIAKAEAVKLLLRSMAEQEIEAVICRAPEFYGPGKTKGITNALVFESLRNGKTPKVLLNDNVVRTLIYTPDASKATALIGNTPDAYGETWHLPCDDQRLTYKEMMALISKLLGREVSYSVMNKFLINVVSLFNSNLKETKELLPRYAIDNIYESKKFKARFPEFQVTTYQEGIEEIIRDFKIV